MDKPRIVLEQVEPLLVQATDAARMLGISRSLWLMMVKDGSAPLPVRLNRRTLWRVLDLREFAAKLPTSQHLEE